jgi:putative photosynthetic complex assembly protein
MTESPHDNDVPRFALVAAAVLVLGTTILAGIARRTDIGTTHVPAAQVVQVRNLRFEDQPDGAVAVRDADSRQVVERFAPASNAFARGVLRGLARERRRESFGQEQPFRLTHWSDGRLSLDDPATGRHVDLEVFGPTNTAVFSRLMTAAAPSS